MSDEELLDVTKELTRSIRERWDKLGYLEAQDGAFATGHIPAIAPQAYLCRFFAGLSDEGLSDAEEESERHIPMPYRQFLKTFNGAEVMDISLFGATGNQNLRDAGISIGEPISIRYQNVFYLRPDFIPEGHFGLGVMNGDCYSQGHLYLTSTGEVELINRDHDLIAARWPSFSDFLKHEIPRQMSRYDEAGAEIKGTKRLPGETDDWEALGKEVSDRRERGGLVLIQDRSQIERVS